MKITDLMDTSVTSPKITANTDLSTITDLADTTITGLAVTTITDLIIAIVTIW